MKKLYTLVMAFCVTFALNAQENLNLDDWSDEITPVGWNALLNNFIGLIGPDTSVIQVDGFNNSGAKLNCVDGTLLNVPAGITLMSLGEDTKPAYDQMLDEVTFYYNFTDETGAVAAAFVALTKWNETAMRPDTLASGSIQISTPNTEFELATVALETSALYTPGDTPDSLSVSVQIVAPDINNSVNKTNMIVDEFVLVPMGESSVKEALFKTPAKVYPTVASDNITVEFKDAVNRTIEILDVNGVVVKTANVNNVSNNVNVSDINAGSYIYRIMKGDVMVNNGKLIIE